MSFRKRISEQIKTVQLENMHPNFNVFNTRGVFQNTHKNTTTFKQNRRNVFSRNLHLMSFNVQIMTSKGNYKILHVHARNVSHSKSKRET